MDEKEIAKLTRSELIRMLIDVTLENEALNEKISLLEKDLESKRIAIEASGSMAEAALKLNKIFEAADAAAKQYLTNIKAKAKEEAKEKKESKNDGTK